MHPAVPSRLETAEGVGVGNASTALDGWLHTRGGLAGGGELTVAGEGELGVEALVDDTGHARLAMSARVLGAVEPDGILVLDNDLEHLSRLALGDGEEAREEGGGVLGLAGVAKGRLDDRMVAGGEVELDHLTDLGHDVVRVEPETTAAGDDRVRDSGLSPRLVGNLGRGAGGGGRRQAGDGSEDGKGLEVGEHFEW